MRSLVTHGVGLLEPLEPRLLLNGSGEEIVVQVDPYVDLGAGLYSFTVHLVGSSPSFVAGGWNGSFDGSLNQIRALGSLNTPTMDNAELIAPPYGEPEEDSHLLLYNADILVAVAPNESMDHLAGSFAIKVGARQQDLPFAQIVLAAGGSVEMTGQVSDSGAQYTFPTEVTISAPASGDVTAPTPDPSTWLLPPRATGATSIYMSTTVATDPSGVEYYFQCVSGAGHDSGWQDSNEYTDTGLESSTSYGYKVRARDKSLGRNATDWSGTAWAATATPILATADPAVYLGEHLFSYTIHLTGQGPTTMASAWNGSFVGPVNQIQAFGSLDTPTMDNAEQIAPPFGEPAEDTHLLLYDADIDPTTAPNESAMHLAGNFTIEAGVRQQDLLFAQIVVPAGETVVMTGQVTNQTGWLSFPTELTLSPPALDETAPTPDPSSWASVSTATSATSIHMAATVASDPSGVEYYFECVSGGGNDSGWQDSNEYEDTGLAAETIYTYRVRTRDKSYSQNTTGWSGALPATTPVAITVQADPPVHVGGGVFSFTVHLVGAGPLSIASGWNGSFDGPMRQLQAPGPLATPTLTNADLIAPAAGGPERDSHFLLYDAEIGPVTAPNESATHLAGDLSIQPSARQDDLPFAQLVILAEQTVVMTGQVLNAGGYPSATELTISAPMRGDANLDGVVDRDDFDSWSAHFEQPGDWADGDYNSDGFVDGADYTLWADNSTVAGGGAAAASVRALDGETASASPEALGSIIDPAGGLADATSILLRAGQAAAPAADRADLPLSQPEGPVLKLAAAGAARTARPAGAVGISPAAVRVWAFADDLVDLLKEPDLGDPAGLP